MKIEEALANPGVEGISIGPVKVTRVFDRKAGENAHGPWSFQDIGVEEGGVKHYVKLKGLPPASECGIKEGLVLSFSSTKGQKGMHGVKVAEERWGDGKVQNKVICTPAVCIRQGTSVLYGNADKATAPPKPPPTKPAEDALTQDQQAYLEANPDDPQLLGYSAPEATPSQEEPKREPFDHESGKFEQAGREIGRVLRCVAEEAGLQVVDVSVMSDTDPAMLAAIAHQQGELYKLASTAFISASGGRR